MDIEKTIKNEIDNLFELYNVSQKIKGLSQPEITAKQKLRNLLSMNILYALSHYKMLK